jgi:hypothetical protein
MTMRSPALLQEPVRIVVLQLDDDSPCPSAGSCSCGCVSCALILGKSTPHCYSHGKGCHVGCDIR